MSTTTYKNMDIEHLGRYAEASDLQAFREACEAYRKTDETDEEITERISVIWFSGNWDRVDELAQAPPVR